MDAGHGKCNGSAFGREAGHDGRHPGQPSAAGTTRDLLSSEAGLHGKRCGPEVHQGENRAVPDDAPANGARMTFASLRPPG